MLDIDFNYSEIPWWIKSIFLCILFVYLSFCLLGIYYLIRKKFTSFVIKLSFGIALTSIIGIFLEIYFHIGFLSEIGLFFIPIDLGVAMFTDKIAEILKVFIPQFIRVLAFFPARFLIIFCFLNVFSRLIKRFQ